jgi:hypothetical protein
VKSILLALANVVEFVVMCVILAPLVLRDAARWAWREVQGLPGAAWVMWAVLVVLAWWVRP